MNENNLHFLLQTTNHKFIQKLKRKIILLENRKKIFL